MVDNTFKLDAAGYYTGKHIHVRDKNIWVKRQKYLYRGQIFLCVKATQYL